MKNWSTDTTELKKDKDAYAIWRCEQLINYGLDGEKLDQKIVRKYWDRLKLDPEDKKFLTFFIMAVQKATILKRVLKKPDKTLFLSLRGRAMRPKQSKKLL